MKGEIWQELQELHLKPGKYEYHDLSHKQLCYVEKIMGGKLYTNDTVDIIFNNLEYMEWVYDQSLCK